MMRNGPENEIAVKIIVGAGLIILLTAIVALVWLFVFGHGFTFNF
jgi:hypothetical protein